jgi:hypothetical protein
MISMNEKAITKMKKPIVETMSTSVTGYGQQGRMTNKVILWKGSRRVVWVEVGPLVQPCCGR